MLGVVLLYVGIVLISNGFYAVEGIKDKSIVVMNFFTGGLGLILNIVSISYGVVAGKPESWFYASAKHQLKQKEQCKRYRCCVHCIWHERNVMKCKIISRHPDNPVNVTAKCQSKSAEDPNQRNYSH
jgi:hypothetical protein